MNETFGTYYPNGSSVRAAQVQDIPGQLGALKDLCSDARVELQVSIEDYSPRIRVSGPDLVNSDGYRGRRGEVIIQKGDWVVVDYNFATKRTEVRVYDYSTFESRFHPDEATRKRLQVGTAAATDAEQEPKAYQREGVQFCSTYEQTLTADAQRLQEAAQRLGEAKRACAAAHDAYIAADREHQERVKALRGLS